MSGWTNRRLVFRLAIVGIGLVLCSSCNRNVYERIPISGPMSIGNEWQEIPSKEPFTPHKKIQWVCILFSEPREINEKEWKPISKVGADFIIELQVVDTDGHAFDLNKTVGLSESTMCFERTPPESWGDILPRDRKYKSVRIKSNHTLSLSGIEWYGYNQEDRP